LFTGGKYGNQLLYTAVVIETTLTPTKLGYLEGKKVVNAWNEYIKEKVRMGYSG
jgi:hypothetical protein